MADFSHARYNNSPKMTHSVVSLQAIPKQRVVKGGGNLLYHDSNMKSSVYQNKEDPRSLNTNKQEDPELQKMTVLITTFNQPFCLLRQISHLQQCSNIIEAIHVNWFDDQNYSPPNITTSLLTSLYNNNTTISNHTNGATKQKIALNSSSIIPVVFDKLPNKLSYRFYPRPFPTKGIFSIDVDMGYSCDALEIAFDTWKKYNSNTNNKADYYQNVDKKHYYSTPVGFHARYLSPYKYYNYFESYHFPYKRNTLFITKGAILHRDVLEEFFAPEYSMLRKLVDESITGEDMLMSFVLSHKYNQYKNNYHYGMNSNDILHKFFLHNHLNADNNNHNDNVQTQPSFVTICHDSYQGCTKECNENNVAPLGNRTGHLRRDLLQTLFQFFGNGTFDSSSSADEQSKTRLKEKKRSRKKLIEEKRREKRQSWWERVFSLQWWWEERSIDSWSSGGDDHDNHNMQVNTKNSNSLPPLLFQDRNGKANIWGKQKGPRTTKSQICGSKEKGLDGLVLQRCGHDFFDSLWMD